MTPITPMAPALADNSLVEIWAISSQPTDYVNTTKFQPIVPYQKADQYPKKGGHIHTGCIPVGKQAAGKTSATTFWQTLIPDEHFFVVLQFRSRDFCRGAGFSGTRHRSLEEQQDDRCATRERTASVDARRCTAKTMRRQGQLSRRELILRGNRINRRDVVFSRRARFTTHETQFR